MKEKSKVEDLNIDIEGFSGPLELLDNLIKEKKLDILDLDISLLANQYNKYIHANLNLLDIDKLSSYLVMATYLFELKSKKLLLTTYDEKSNEDFEYERDKLVQRIIEYRKYKEVANKLIAKKEKRSMMYSKPSDLVALNENATKTFIEKLPSFINPQKLLDAIMSAYEKYHFSLFSKNKIVVQELSVDEIRNELVDFLKENVGGKISFSEYLANVDELKISDQYIVTAFLALLELVKYHVVNLEQDISNEIHITINDSINTENFIDGKEN